LVDIHSSISNKDAISNCFYSSYSGLIDCGFILKIRSHASPIK